MVLQMDKTTCPFCELAPERIVDANKTAVLVHDQYPLTPGHSLVLPRRHIQSIFDAMPDELNALWQLVERARSRIDRVHAPAGYNLGINDGPAAGQTVSHLHIHIIPRYLGDTTDPRGGVRWIIPDRAPYWDSDI